MAKFPSDQFDDIPDDLVRVGAHRAPAKKGRGWLAFLWAVLATVALVAAGLFTLSRIDSDFSLDLFPPQETPTPTPTPTPTAEPVTDPSTLEKDFKKSLTISVLNATPTPGLADTAGDQIKDAGWPDPARANASERNRDETIVYYNGEEYEGVARGLAQLLGVQKVENSEVFPGAKITIVLGTDYVPPAE